MLHKRGIGSSNLNIGSSGVDKSPIDRSLRLKKDVKLPNHCLLICLNHSCQRFAFNYQGRRIGIVTPGIDIWFATAELQYSGIQRRFKTLQSAINWLLNNYFQVQKKYQIQFSISENLCHYTIESRYWLIKIDVREEDCIAVIREGNNSTREYFPTLNDAIAFSFDLILNSDRSTDCSCDEEF